MVRCFVKGAPDVLIARSSYYWLPGEDKRPVTDENRKLALDENERIAKAGERVMVVARKDFDPQTFDPKSKVDRSDEGPHPPGDGRHRRSAAQRSQGCHRQMPQRRHPGAHDHRRPCRDGCRHRPASWASPEQHSPALNLKP